jgi:hypothetical protein
MDKGKSPDIHGILAKIIQAGKRRVASELHKILIILGRRRNNLGNGGSQSFYLFIRRLTKYAVLIIERYHYYKLHTKSYPAFCYQN